MCKENTMMKQFNVELIAKSKNTTKGSENKKCRNSTKITLNK